MGNRRRKTWTFQPDDDVAAEITKLVGGDLSPGNRTKIINEALRLRYAEAIMANAAQELNEANERMKRLRKIVSVISSKNKKAVLSGADSKMKHAHQAVQPSQQVKSPAHKSHQEKAP